MVANPKFIAATARVDEAAVHPLPNSRKVYVAGSHPDLRVRATADAKIRLAIDKAPSLPRPPAPPRSAADTSAAPKGKSRD